MITQINISFDLFDDLLEVVGLKGKRIFGDDPDETLRGHYDVVWMHVA